MKPGVLSYTCRSWIDGRGSDSAVTADPLPMRIRSAMLDLFETIGQALGNVSFVSGGMALTM